MEAMLRLDGVWSAGNNALLRTVLQAGATADARIGDTIALFLGFRLPGSNDRGADREQVETAYHAESASTPMAVQ